jgi:Fic family protein
MASRVAWAPRNYIRITKASRATATRDLNGLVAKGVPNEDRRVAAYQMT